MHEHVSFVGLVSCLVFTHTQAAYKWEYRHCDGAYSALANTGVPTLVLPTLVVCCLQGPFERHVGIYVPACAALPFYATTAVLV